MTVCPKSAILADAHTGWLALSNPSSRLSQPTANHPRIQCARAALKHPCRTRRRGFQLVDTKLPLGSHRNSFSPGAQRRSHLVSQAGVQRKKSFAAAGPGFLGGLADLLGQHLPAAPGGLAGQEGAAHKSRRAQARRTCESKRAIVRLQS